MSAIAAKPPSFLNASEAAMKPQDDARRAQQQPFGRISSEAQACQPCREGRGVLQHRTFIEVPYRHVGLIHTLDTDLHLTPLGTPVNSLRLRFELPVTTTSAEGPVPFARPLLLKPTLTRIRTRQLSRRHA